MCYSQSIEDASEECLLKFHDEVFRIEDPSQNNGDTPQQEGEGEDRIKKPDCDHCKVSIEPEMMSLEPICLPIIFCVTTHICMHVIIFD